MPEQEFIQCTVGGPVKVTVKDGIITRMRPIVLNDKEDAPSWVIDRNGSLPALQTPCRWKSRKDAGLPENRIKSRCAASTDPNGERHPNCAAGRICAYLPR
jgi:hypothetical protein